MKNRVVEHVVVLGSSGKPRLDVHEVLVPVTHNQHVDLGLALATDELVVLPPMWKPTEGSVHRKQGSRHRLL